MYVIPDLSINQIPNLPGFAVCLLTLYLVLNSPSDFNCSNLFGVFIASWKLPCFCIRQQTSQRNLIFMNENDDDIFDRRFSVTKIEKTDPPEGMPEGEWYHYVIGRGTSEIQGKRPGTLESVIEHVEEFVENLNRRALLGYSAYAAAKPVKTNPDSEKS